MTSDITSSSGKLVKMRDGVFLMTEELNDIELDKELDEFREYECKVCGADMLDFMIKCSPLHCRSTT